MAHQLKYLMGLGLGALTAKVIGGTIADNLAATGTTQDDALQLTEDNNVVSIVTANSGVKLPPIPQPGDELLIANLGANPVNIYPGTGGTIQNGSPNIPYSLNAGATATFIARRGSANWIVSSTGGSIGASPTPTAPVLTVNPSISGTAQVGQVLTATHGTYTGIVTSYAGQWYSGASPISLATSLTYTQQNSDVGNSITYRESAYNTSPTYSSAMGTSNALGPVTAAPVAPTLSSPTASPGSTTASLGVTTDQANGTLYWIVCTSATPPTKTQLAAGQDSSGSTAAAHGSQAVSATGAQSASATGLTASTTYYAYFLHINASSLQSNVAASSSFGTAGSGTTINAPTYALHTAAGASPASWDVTGDSTFQTGMYVHQQFAADSGFTTPVPNATTVDYLTQVEGSDWEATSDTIGNGMVTFVQPTGTYWTRCRFETIPGDSTNNVTSPWSNVITDTINASTAILSTTDYSAYLIRDGNYQAHSNSGGDFMQLIRANIQQANQKGHWEVTINNLSNEASPAGSISINLMDSLGNEAIPVGSNPGQTIPGFTFMVTRGSTTVTLFRNGAGDTSKSLSSAPAIGDTLSLDYDYTAHTIYCRYQHLGGALDDLGPAITLSTQVPAVPFAAMGVYDKNDSTHYDQGTFNPGNAAFAITPLTGFTIYG